MWMGDILCVYCTFPLQQIIEEQTHKNNYNNYNDNNSILVNLRLVKVVCCLTINLKSLVQKWGINASKRPTGKREEVFSVLFLTRNQKRFHTAVILILFLTAEKEWFLFICIDHPIIVFLWVKRACACFSAPKYERINRTMKQTLLHCSSLTCYSRSLYLAKAFLKRQMNITWYNISLSLNRYHSAEVIMNAVVARWRHVCLV